MSTAGYLALLADLAGLAVDDEAKQAFRSIVEARLREETPDQGARIIFVRRQLDAGEARADICRQLCDRFGVGKSQAYRDIEAVLNLSHQMGNL